MTSDQMAQIRVTYLTIRARWKRERTHYLNLRNVTEMIVFAVLLDAVSDNNLTGVNTRDFIRSVGHQKEQLIHRSVGPVRTTWH